MTNSEIFTQPMPGQQLFVKSPILNFMKIRYTVPTMILGYR